LVSEQSQSGQTVSAFCRDRGIRDSQFYDWKKRVREGEAAKFVEVKVKESSEQRTPAPERFPAIEIRLSNGAQPFGRAWIRCESSASLAGRAGDGSMIGLPSLHALDRSQGPRIWLAAEATDMRCGFDRLAERVKSVIGQDPSGNSLFVFRSRRGDRLKILTWDRDGFVLWYKRLESGSFQAAADSCRSAFD
jgi:transposase